MKIIKNNAGLLRSVRNLGVLGLVLALAFVVGYGQEPRQPQSPSNEFNVSVNNNKLVFKTIEDYEKVVNNPTEEIRRRFIATVNSFKNFTSLAKASATNKQRNRMNSFINDEYFTSILNPDLIVQIEQNIFRVNPLTEKVYVLSAVHEDQYRDLIAENTANTNIRQFSASDNVLEILEVTNKGGNPTPLGGCTGIGSYKEEAISTALSNNGLTMEGWLRFRRFGVYFSLFAEVEVQLNGSTVDGFAEAVIHLEPVYYKKRRTFKPCEKVVGPYFVSWYGLGDSRGHKRYQSYSGSRDLNEVYFRGRFQAFYNNVSFASFNWIEIKVNCPSNVNFAPAPPC